MEIGTVEKTQGISEVEEVVRAKDVGEATGTSDD